VDDSSSLFMKREDAEMHCRSKFGDLLPTIWSHIRSYEGRAATDIFRPKMTNLHTMPFQ
jgi:hypothetical protein